MPFPRPSSTSPRRARSMSAPAAVLPAGSNNVGAAAAACDPQLISSLARLTAEQQAKSSPSLGGGGKEETGTQAEEGALQREMLKDPRFGSPLLCDALVMLLALVPLFCGFMSYFAETNPTSTSSGYNYGLALCGIFIFLLGLRSASLHLINCTDTTEDRVLYILDKFGGSVWIPKVPEVTHVDGPSWSHGPPTSGTASGMAAAASAEAATAAATSMPWARSEPEPYRLVLDPASSSVFLLSDMRPTQSSSRHGCTDATVVI